MLFQTLTTIILACQVPTGSSSAIAYTQTKHKQNRCIQETIKCVEKRTTVYTHENEALTRCLLERR